MQGTAGGLRRRVFLAGVAAMLALASSACGGSSSSAPAPRPFTERAAVDAFRKAGVQITAVLHPGKSCKSIHPSLPANAQAARVAKLYACGKLADARIDTTNLPGSVLLVGAFAPVPNYLISVYPDTPHAASTGFWLKTVWKPGRGAGFANVPVSALRKGNVVVAGLMRKSEIAATNRAFAHLKLP